MIVLTVAVIHLALVAFTPGMAILLSTVPLVFYAQVCYASLFIETFAGIAGGLLLEFAGVGGRVSLPRGRSRRGLPVRRLGGPRAAHRKAAA